MTLLFALLFLLQAAPSSQQGDSAPPGVGSVEKLELTSLTRDTAHAWIRAFLPKPAKGLRQTFSGEITAAGVRVPTGPIRVAVQSAKGTRAEAVFSVDVAIADLPDELLAKVGTHALDVTVQGTLAGEEGSQEAVYAVGLLRYGTSDIEAPAGSGTDFARLESARFTSVGFLESNGEARLRLYNPFSFDIPLKGVTYELSAGDRRLASGEMPALRVHGRREVELVLPLRARNADLIAVAGSTILSGGTLDARLTGAITIRAAKGDVVLPISAATRVELSR